MSWTHHWTLAVPALLLLGLRVYRNRSKVGIIAVGATLLVGYSYLPKLMERPAFSSALAIPAGWTLVSTSYVLIGLVALGFVCVHETRLLPGLQRRRPAPRRGLRWSRRRSPLGASMGYLGRSARGAPERAVQSPMRRSISRDSSERMASPR